MFVAVKLSRLELLQSLTEKGRRGGGGLGWLPGLVEAFRGRDAGGRTCYIR